MAISPEGAKPGTPEGIFFIKKGPADQLQILEFQSGWRDLNSRPLAPQTSTLTGLSYIPKVGVSVGVSVGVEVRIAKLQFF